VVLIKKIMKLLLLGTIGLGKQTVGLRKSVKLRKIKDLFKVHKQSLKKETKMENLVKFFIVVMFVGMIAGVGVNSCAYISGAHSESAYDSARQWANENNIKVNNISCRNDGNCTINSNGKFIGLICPIMFERGSCTVKVRSIDLQE
jgi:hypothetical protein